MNLKSFFLFLIVLFLAAGSVFSQGIENAGEDVTVRLSLAEGKTVYRIGEPIRLILSFTAKTGAYNLEKIESPQLEQITVSPAVGVYDWRYRYNRAYSYDDVSMRAALSAKPETVELFLNDSVRFDKAGNYSLKITTKRVSAKREKSDWGEPVQLVSNTVDFEIKEMSESEEQAEVKRLGVLIDAQKDWREQDKFVRELSYLTGDASTVDKVGRFLNPGNYIGNYQGHIRTGLLIARNKSLAVKLLEAAFRDLSREAEFNLIYTLVALRLLQEEDDLQTGGDAADAKSYAERKNKRSAEIERAYYDELIKNLPKRAGKSRLVTAYTIFTRLPKEDQSSGAFNATRSILLENFDRLTPMGKEQLLGSFWEKVKTPSLVSSLEKMIADKADPIYSGVRAIALKRLIELDRKRARPLVVDEIGDYTSFIDVDVLAMLDDKTLPEIDDALLENIRRAAPLSVKNRDYQILYMKNLLAARYASARIYPDLMEIYKTSEGGWLEDARGALLGYFARYNADEAVSLIEERLNKLGGEADSTVFYSIAKMGLSEGLESFLQKRLESDVLGAADNAAYLLSKHGAAENQKLIENRHNRWLKEWSARGAELDDPNADPKIKRQAMVQINLIESLITAKSWKTSDAEIKRLTLLCAAQTCRQHFGIRYTTDKN